MNIKKTHDLKFLLLIPFCLLFVYRGTTQEQKKNYTDSLIQIVNSNIADSIKVKTLISLGWYYRSSDNKAALKYSKQALALSNKLRLGFEKGKALNNIGAIYYFQGEYDNSLINWLKALQIFEKMKENTWIAKMNGNIGLIYELQGKYDKALECQNKCLKIQTKQNDKHNQAKTLNNIGVLYGYLDKHDTELTYYLMALKINIELKDSEEIASNYDNIGTVYFQKNKFQTAILNHEKSLKIFEKINNEYGIASALINISSAEMELGQLNDAEKNLLISLNYAKKINYREMVKSIYQTLSELYEKKHLYQKALSYLNQFYKLKDSLQTENNQQYLLKLETEFETEKKEQQIKLQKTEIEKGKEHAARQKAENRKQKLIIIFVLTGFIITAIFLVFILRLLSLKKKANRQLAAQKKEISKKNKKLNQQAEELKLLNENLHNQNAEISAQRDEIESQKNKIETIHHEVTQSIAYAQRIQNVALPQISVLQDVYPESFVLFKPKDVVSGDFYWWTHVEIDNTTVITVADCTGHGVPGAFMSMLGISFLREIVTKEYITHPGVILRKLRKEIIKALKQKGEEGEQKDGMDMSLIAINHEVMMLQFAGANNPLYLIRDSELQEFKGDKMPIAIYEKMDSFYNHKIQLEKGDMIYMFSDGYADQFGGPNNKKFKYKPFKQLLIDNAHKSMSEQKDILEKIFNEWKGEHEQVDDVTIFGIKI